MKRFIIGFGWLMAACVAVAGTGTSNEFRVDTRTGVRTAAATEKIQYSTAWATNLTAAQQGEATAVVKIDGVPVELADVSGSFDWTAPSDIGIYRFTHQIFTNGVQVGETLNAAFKVAGELNIVNVKARQRYPWNGLVDVDCDIVGDPEKVYRVTLTAKDVGGGTNLPVRTAWQVGGSVTNGEFLVGLGHYRFVWNAAADLPREMKFREVAMEVTGIDMEIRSVSATDAASVNSGIIISWEKNESAVAYRVYREGEPDVMIGETTDLTFEDASLTMSGTYTYYVRGVFGDHEGIPSRSCSAKCLRLPVCADPLVYLPLDGDVKNYGMHPCTFGRYADDAEWLWLENRFGEDGRASYLTSAQRIVFPSTQAFCVSNTFTIAFWAKSESGLSTIVEERESGNYGVIGAKYPFVLYPAYGGDDGEAGIGIAVGTNGVAVVEHAGAWFPATLVFASNIGSGWNHFAVTVADNGAAVLFVNGIKVRTGLVSSKVKKITNTNIGGSADYGKYVGYVDDFMIYGRALSADEVDALCYWENPRPVAPTYSVTFSANGGSGTMANELFTYGTAKALTGVAATGKSAAFPVDLREGDRVSAGSEELTFSNLWDGDADATVTIAQDGAAIFTGLSDEGVKTWSVDRNGRYVLTHTTYTNGVKGKVENAVFVVEGKDVPVGELTVEWETGSYKYDSNGKTPGVTAKDGDTLLVKGVDYTVRYEGNTNAGTAKAILTGLPPYVGSVTNEFAIAKRLVELTSGTASKSYDGTPLVCHSVTTNGDGFVSGEGVDFIFSGSQTTVGTSKNTFDYTFKSGTLAGNYTITKTEGDLEVTSGKIVNPFDPDDPSKPVTPEVLAKVNCITNYDGDGHSIEVVAFLNPLIAANNPKITYSLQRDGTYEAKNPSFTNVVSTSVWYRIEADNFNLFTTNALLKILPRSITNVNVAAIGDQTYTGSGIEPIPAVTDMRTLIGMSEPTDILSSADYDLSYLNNTNVGTAKIVLSGKNNYEGSQTNAFQIVPAIIPPGPDGAIVATGYTNAYDGAAHGVSVSATGLKTQPTVQYKRSPTAEWQDDSPTYTDVCDTQVWWKVFAPNYQSVEGTIGLKITQAANAWTTEPAIDGWTYGETAKTPVGAAKFGEVAFAYSPMPVAAAGDYTMTATVAGTANYTGLSKTVDFTIEKATLPGGGEEPGGEEKPEGGASKFDTVVMYDGEGHTIRTNELVAAFKAAVGGDVAVEYACGGAGVPALPWMAVAPDFTNVCKTSVWYKVTSANYQDFTHEAKVTVTNRPVTLTSGTKLDFAYDGKPHAFTSLAVTAGSFVAGEGIATSNWATVTAVAEGQVPNAFDYAPLDGTKLSNYALAVVTGKIAVVSPDAVVVAVTGHVASVVYDGLKKSVSGYDIVSISDPLYTAADFKFTGQSSTNGTNAGTYPMGLKSADFANTNPNFASVVFNVTDGRLVISQAENAWTTVPAIDGWTYGETAKTPVGATKFGEVSFAYDPMPVGAAGDYTMTATVAGTANYTGLSKTVPFTISKATLPGGGEEPGGGTVPEGGVSKFDTVAMYDGEGHTTKTNELVAAFKSVIGNDFAVSYAVGESGGLGQPATPWSVKAPVYTNVGEHVVWYKVASANNQDFVHEAKVTVTNRPVTLTSGTKLDFTYDGKPHAYTNLTVTAGSFVAGEGITTSNWATVTTVAEGEVPNAFDFEAEEGTLLSNYALTVVTGRIAVVSPDAVVVTVTGHVASVVYDGVKKSVSGYDIVSISDPLYTAADFTFGGQSATNGTNAGTYPMGLKASDFSNTNPNFASVVFNVTDGSLVIAQAQNAWTTEPAIDGWTYGETAKTPVGAAKFGEVSFANSPMPVAAAGDYTMTATVAGTANYTGLSKTVGFTIAKATLPGGGEEPGGGTVPEGGVSKFDTVVMYDGEGHTIKTNDLVAAFKAAVGGDVVVEYACGGAGVPALPWMAVAPDFTNVCVTSVWYKVASANYLDFVHEAKVTVTNRPVTLTSGTESFDYDGNAHSNMTVAVGGEGFVVGEGVTSNNFATITEKGTKPNAFDYELILNPGSVSENYSVMCVTGTLTVVAVANAWIVEPKVTGKAYDGTPAAVTMGTPKFGMVSVTYDGGQTAAPVGAGDHTAKFVVVATADYGALEKVINYTITKATLPGGGEEPGGGTVPEGGVSKFDTVVMYDGAGHTIATNEMRIAFAPYTSGQGSASPFRFAASSEGPWGELPTVVTNVGTTSVWYKFTSANYEDFTHEAKLTIAPRDIERATVADIPDQEHTGTAIKPPVTVTDGDPTIITSDDYTVAYSDNIAIGQATVTLTGKRNYTGTKTVHFMIKGSSAAALKAEIAWKLLKASGTYMAQLKVTCTSGLATGISNLRFMFADRVSGGTTFASLWDTPKRAAKSTTMPYSGDTYRYVALDASRITAENVAVTYGVSHLAATSIPTAERTIELYVRKRVNPTTGKEEAAVVDNFVGYVSWTSGGEPSYLPVVAGAQAASLAKAALRAQAPMKLAAVNTALAVGSVIAEGSSPYCKLTEFAVSDNEITGVVEVGAVSSDGVEYPGKLGPNATVTLLGTNNLGQGFKEICSVTSDSAGRFRIAKPKDCQFFKLKLTVEEVVE